MAQSVPIPRWYSAWHELAGFGFRLICGIYRTLLLIIWFDFSFTKQCISGSHLHISSIASQIVDPDSNAVGIRAALYICPMSNQISVQGPESCFAHTNKWNYTIDQVIRDRCMMISHSPISYANSKKLFKYIDCFKNIHFREDEESHQHFCSKLTVFRFGMLTLDCDCDYNSDAVDSLWLRAIHRCKKQDSSARDIVSVVILSENVFDVIGSRK